MTHMLVHELATEGNDLIVRLRTVLSRQPGPIASDLLARAKSEPREKPMMVLTGQYSSGKSKLIEALTDGAVRPISHADIATDEVTPYEWDGAVVLVDTPGVKSGLREHDDKARAAVGDADFILFVVNVGLLDNAASEYLRRITIDLRLHGQTIVVITQSGMQSAAPGIRENEVHGALGTSSFTLPIVEVDSVYYLRSLEGGPRSEQLRARSGIDSLRSAINTISVARGDLAQLRQPIHLVRQLCDEAQELFVPDDNSKLALSLLASQHAAAAERRNMIDHLFKSAEDTFKSACRVDVIGFVDTATSVPADDAEARLILAEAKERLADALGRHAQQFADVVNRLVEVQTTKLTEQLLEIEQGNRAGQLLMAAGEIILDGPVELDTETGRSAGRQRPQERASREIDLTRVVEQLKQGRTWWGAGDGVRNSAGTAGHKMVKEVGHVVFDKKFAPWEAVKIADKIGKAVKVAGFVVQIGSAGYEIWRDEREARRTQVAGDRQHAAFVTEIMGHADRISANARSQLASVVDPRMEALIDGIRAAQESIIGADEARSDAGREIAAISAEADRLLAESSDLSAVERDTSDQAGTG